MEMGWTTQEYFAQPNWFVESINSMMNEKAEFENEQAEKQKRKSSKR